ncbi:helix-turn-helix transcriptional regulator [Nocardioides sp.]|uniref:helix-turn-helix domain-containing protein n=1 Tax=Nocardioides sp. TaxID=35761 RepID=UPI0026210454|nr:helix-turn-helix transcriptional regulator [Nocardioides sp.]
MDMPSPEYLARFEAALVMEIKAARARRGITSSRELAELLGENPQWVSNRLDGGNPRTGKRVAISVTDLMRIAEVLEMQPVDLIKAAEKAALSEAVEVVAVEFGKQRPTGSVRTAARSPRKPDGRR